jgi:hypothetical protein
MSYLKHNHKNDIFSQYNLKEHFTEIIYKDLKIDLDWNKVSYATYFILYEDRKYVSKQILFHIFSSAYVKKISEKVYNTIIQDYCGYLPETKEEKELQFEGFVNLRKELLINLLQNDVWNMKFFRASVLLENTDNLFVIDNMYNQGWTPYDNSVHDLIKAITNKKMMRDLYENLQVLYEYGKNKPMFIYTLGNLGNYVHRGDEISTIDVDSFHICKYFFGYLQLHFKQDTEIWFATFKDYWDVIDVYIEEVQCKTYKKLLIQI